MCRSCRKFMCRARPRQLIHISHLRPGTSYSRVRFPEQSPCCTILFYNERANTIKIFCPTIESYRYWFPQDEVEPFGLLCNNVWGMCSALVAGRELPNRQIDTNDVLRLDIAASTFEGKYARRIHSDGLPSSSSSTTSSSSSSSSTTKSSRSSRSSSLPEHLSMFDDI